MASFIGRWSSRTRFRTLLSISCVGVLVACGDSLSSTDDEMGDSVGVQDVPGQAEADHLDEKLGEAEARRDTPDELVQVVYRGVQRTVARYGDQLILEGDIVVGQRDLEASETGSSIEKGVRTSGQRGASSNTFQWTGGTVPYTFDVNVTAAQQADINNAMTEWSSVIHGLTFVPRTTQADYVTFRITTNPNICGSSSVGRQGGQQIILLNADCVSGYSTHHEIGHALGLFHEQSRTDLASNITINWNNIRGCTDTATSSAQCGNAACTANPLSCGCTADEVSGDQCNYSHNFGATPTSANLGAYDFDSVMHYPRTAFGKCRNAAGATVLCSAAGAIVRTTLVPPAGTTIGQRAHLSTGDLYSMNVMYPRNYVHGLLFANTGTQRVCQLQGREQDVGTLYSVSGFPTSLTTDTMSTAGLPQEDYSVTCTASSMLWSKNYAVPNSTIGLTSGEVSSASAWRVETYSDTQIVRVLDPGLIAVMFVTGT